MDDPALSPYAPPRSDDPPPAPARTAPPGEITLGQRIAGALLIANGVLSILDHLATASSSGGPGSGFVAIIFDFLIGYSLLTRNAKYLGWAIFRAAAGGLLFGGMWVAKGEMLLAAIQVAVSGSFLLLLIKDAGKARIALAGVLFGLYALMEIIGLVTTGSG